MDAENAEQRIVSLKLSLLENAYDSLNESLAKVAQAAEDPGQWKFAVLNLVHALELLLKHRLHEEHRLLLFENVDRPNRTVSLERALERLRSVEVTIEPRDVAAIDQAIKWRNAITHYETDLLIHEVRENYLLIFEFLDSFHLTHFQGGLTQHLSVANAPTAAQMVQEFRSEFVEFQGRSMHRSWPHKLLTAQKYPEVSCEGIIFQRIHWGRESHWEETRREGYVPREHCRDCGCRLGELHGPGCCVEECPRCGDQFTYCDCDLESDGLWDLLPPISEEGLEALETPEE
ncbi:hypothetical protein QBL02_08500 [Leucobacter sp. UT-8R-CII-1-4]|uniref:hypothetical protein n=1 Tax=Leucobacter sp. UT-8R-CII-1-4 TaxID=3040075 RepID=UPI0024A89307|nr:hypothetical protein [Leucobacter sp. UT-8R-CII-1-4]MDI6023583.1 hypothetical protein [Leucobacter sp. UT-8R-CII-1-4]